MAAVIRRQQGSSNDQAMIKISILKRLYVGPLSAARSHTYFTAYLCDYILYSILCGSSLLAEVVYSHMPVKFREKQ